MHDRMCIWRCACFSGLGFRVNVLLICFVVQILELSLPKGGDVRLFRQFLSTFIGPMFARCSSRIEDLQVPPAAFPPPSMLTVLLHTTHCISLGALPVTCPDACSSCCNTTGACAPSE